MKNAYGIYLNTNINDFVSSGIKAASKYNTFCFGRVPVKFNPKINLK
jgi:hypothetical protein